MKKATFAILAVVMVMSLAACNNEQSKKDMVIAPSKFSEETQKILKIIGDEIIFFDYTIDDTIKSVTIGIWTYEDGQWISSGGAYDKIDAGEHKFAVRMMDGICEIFPIDGNGLGKASFKNTADFGDSNITVSPRLTDSTTIEKDKEILLLSKLGTDKGYIRTGEMDDFRTAECTAGVAFTITFSDRVSN